MITPSMQHLQDFITDNRLKNADGTTAFIATINFYKNEILQSISSEVQVVNIPGMMALYVLEFFKDVYQFPDMYSTADFYFRYNKNIPLQICVADKDSDYLISVLPLKA